MQIPAFITMLKPDMASLGYGLFLAINAASVWGGSFPFLPMDFQTSSVLFWFFLAQSVVFTFSFFASAAGTYWFPNQTRRFLVKVVVAPYLLGWCLLIGGIYFPSAAQPLAFVGGGLLGLGSAGFYMLWQRLFASQEAEEGNRNLIVGTAWAALLYFALYLIPVAVTAYLIPLVFLPLFGLAVVLKSRTIDLDQPMFEDIPRDHPRTYRHVASHLWRPALAIGALGFCTGIMRSLAVVEPSVGSLVNVLSMLATLVAAVALLAAWTVKNLHFSVGAAYRVFFPLVTTALLVLPLAGPEYARTLAAVLYALWSVAIMLMMIQCAQLARDGGINPVFVYGLFGGIVYALHDVGFIGGHYVESLMVFGIPSVVLVVVVAIWLLGIMYFIGQGGFRSAVGQSTADEIELMALRRPQAPASATGVQLGAGDAGAGSGAATVREGETAVTSSGSTGTATPAGDRERQREAGAQDNLASKTNNHPESEYRDRFSKQMAMVREAYGLSARETEVAELIARGNSVARIAEMLVVSENTIRTHSKRIYSKLDVHKRQELIDLVESFEPAEG
ncbi:helix-turn-helix transcriptional regulator [Adlercreutzia equolifaciens]|uniref:response regulator transcription factor n=1 Tax=Adlercreutzia equolifaciens TaxID=446660 RepID=UPI0023B0BA2A|nr:helix-turn-helix transcriptional regulator [Adlercreutzia equolifaciens]MDE8701455.1 helix-turn-helix transcriptional regulator [Adlercreutzia equolifaciens]